MRHERLTVRRVLVDVDTARVGRPAGEPGSHAGREHVALNALDGHDRILAREHDGHAAGIGEARDVLRA